MLVGWKPSRTRVGAIRKTFDKERQREIQDEASSKNCGTFKPPLLKVVLMVGPFGRNHACILRPASSRNLKSADRNCELAVDIHRAEVSSTFYIALANEPPPSVQRVMGLESAYWELEECAAH